MLLANTGVTLRILKALRGKLGLLLVMYIMFHSYLLIYKSCNGFNSHVKCSRLLRVRLSSC